MYLFLFEIPASGIQHAESFMFVKTLASSQALT